MIKAEDLNSVVDTIKKNGLSEELVGELRGRFSDYHFTYCMDDDMDAHTPAQSHGSFNVYYVNSTNHCSSLTKDPDQASGFVLAEVLSDD